MKKVFVETERLILREWLAGDYDLLAAINADKEVMKYFPSTLTKQQTFTFIEKRILPHFTEYGYSVYAVELKYEKKFIGFCGFMHPSFENYFTPCVEIGWRLDKDYWNKGFATEAATACLKIGFSILGFTEIYSFTSIHNSASERVMQKIGMQNMGTFQHPLIEEGHYLQEHVLYKITK